MPVRTATDPLGPTECSELTLRSLFRVLQIFHLFFRRRARARRAERCRFSLTEPTTGPEKLATFRAGACGTCIARYLFKTCAQHKTSLRWGNDAKTQTNLLRFYLYVGCYMSYLSTPFIFIVFAQGVLLLADNFSKKDLRRKALAAQG